MSADDYKRAQSFAMSGQYKEAWEILAQKLIDNPMDLRALVTSSYVMLKLGGLPQAYHFARTATQIAPKDDATWTNLGHAASQMWLEQEAEECYRTALKCARSEDHKKVLLLNLAALYIDNGRFAEAEKITQRLLAIDPQYPKAIANLGFCQLAARNWEGWKKYRNTIGSDWRPKVQYKNEPEWDGSPGKTVALYEDQGLGDAVAFASVLPDAAKVCKKLILDCDPRLAPLFRRSFPQVKIYGTRRATDQKWDREDWDIEASLPLGQLGEFFRTNDAEFPGKAYLVPCPDRTAQWKSLFVSKGKPVIGIAWSGGISKTGARIRHFPLSEWAPALRKIDAHFVCLQYKDASQEIAKLRSEHPEIDIQQYPWATLTQDYDDTAALVAALDAVISVPTAVVHLAGALGVKTFAMKAKASCWKFQSEIPYHDRSAIQFLEHGNSWNDVLHRAIKAYSNLEGDQAGIHRLRPSPADRIQRIAALNRDARIGAHRSNAAHP